MRGSSEVSLENAVLAKFGLASTTFSPYNFSIQSLTSNRFFWTIPQL